MLPPAVLGPWEPRPDTTDHEKKRCAQHGSHTGQSDNVVSPEVGGVLPSAFLEELSAAWERVEKSGTPLPPPGSPEAAAVSRAPLWGLTPTMANLSISSSNHPDRPLMIALRKPLATFPAVCYFSLTVQ